MRESRGKLRVAAERLNPEIFYTIQGEGRNIGQPTVFLRTSECNLQCTWCDTPYTWNFDGTPYVHDDGVKYSRDEQQIKLSVGDAIDRLTQEKCKHVVISGGEPMLQQAELLELARGLVTEDATAKIDIETNGTITPSPDLYAIVNLFTVSPKLSNSGNSKEKRYKYEAIKVYSQLPNADFKFVIQTEQDLEDALEIINRHQIPSDRIYLMPEGRTKEELDKTAGVVAELAKELGFNFTSRLHIELWGDKRGV